MKHKLISITMSFILIIALTAVPGSAPRIVQAKDKGYLVLVQTYINEYTEDKFDELESGNKKYGVKSSDEEGNGETEDSDNEEDFDESDLTKFGADESDEDTEDEVGANADLSEDRDRMIDEGIYSGQGSTLNSCAANKSDSEDGDTAVSSGDNKEKADTEAAENEGSKYWIGYDNIICEAANGTLMIKAYDAARYLGYTYDNLGKDFSVGGDFKCLTFTKNSAKYKYEVYNKDTFKLLKTYPKTANCKAYTSSSFDESANVFDYTALSNLNVYLKYFNGDEAAEYKALGYKGVICLSNSNEVKSLPDIMRVRDHNGFRLVPNPKIKLDLTSQPGYYGTVTIGDVKVPKLTRFATRNINTFDWGADDYKKKFYPMEIALDEFDEYLHYAVIALSDFDNGGDDSQLAVLDTNMFAEIEGDSTMSALRLNKRDDCYSIYIHLSLNYTGTIRRDLNTHYTRLCNNVLKLYCTVISSTPEQLYQAIYDSWETDNSHGINEKTWVTIGDAKVKIEHEGDGYNYLVKEK